MSIESGNEPRPQTEPDEGFWMAGHRAQMDAWRKGWGGNCLCSFQPGLVYLLERHHHRSLLSDGRPAAAPGPSISHHRRQELFPRREQPPRLTTGASVGPRLGITSATR